MTTQHFTRREALTVAGMAALAAGASAGLAGCTTPDSSPAAIEGAVPGTYLGTGTGAGGHVSALVSLSDTGSIDAIEILKNAETQGFADNAMQRFAENVISSQSLRVDTVSGATISVSALKAALESALDQAQVLDHYRNAEPRKTSIPTLEDDSADIVVVGGGVAGLMCAIKAAQGGKSVVLLEKMDYLGGSMIRCDSTWLCAGGMKDGLRLGGEAWTPYYDESTPVTNREWIRIGGCMNDLLDMGALFTPYQDDPLAEFWLDQTRMAAPRWRDGNAQIGARLIEALYASGARVHLSTPVVGLITDGQTVTGVEAQQSDGSTFTITAPAVVLATGNYSRNPDIMAKYCPQYTDVLKIYVPGDTGDALEWVEPLGAKLHDMDVAPGCVGSEQTQRNLPYFTVYYSLCVDQTGKRYANEGDGSWLDYTNVEAQAVELFPDDPTHYYIMDSGLWELYPARMEYDALVAAGIVRKFDTLEEIANEMGLVDFPDTVRHYNEMVKNGEDSDFGRGIFFQEFSTEGPYWVATVTPGVYLDYGGICVDRWFNVVNENDEPIPGLYAIGQTTGALMRMEGLDSADNGVSGNATSGWILGQQLAGVFQGGTYTAAASVDGKELQMAVTVDDNRTITATEFPVVAGDEPRLKALAKEVVDTQAMPAEASGDPTQTAFIEALAVCLQKADTYFEFINS